MLRAFRVACLAVVLVGSSAGAAGEVPALSCRSAGAGLSGEVLLFETGRAELRVGRKGRKFSCELRMRSFELLARAEVPETRLEFDRGSCKPKLDGDTERELLVSPLTLRISEGRGLLQWLRHEQPGSCGGVSFDRRAVQTVHDRWERAHQDP